MVTNKMLAYLKKSINRIPDGLPKLSVTLPSGELVVGVNDIEARTFTLLKINEDNPDDPITVMFNTLGGTAKTLGYDDECIIVKVSNDNDSISVSLYIDLDLTLNHVLHDESYEESPTVPDPKLFNVPGIELSPEDVFWKPVGGKEYIVDLIKEILHAPIPVEGVNVGEDKDYVNRHTAECEANAGFTDGECTCGTKAISSM